MNKCVALKKSIIMRHVNLMLKREVDVLEFFEENVPYNQRNYIIKIFGHKEENSLMYIVLELGGKNLKKYFHENRNPRARVNEELLIKIIKGAALALEQFHKFGIHGDIKSENFVVSLEQNPELDFIEFKLIDFNVSIIRDQQFIQGTKEISVHNKAPEIHGKDEITPQGDVWAFGIMVYELFNDGDFIESMYRSNYDSNNDYNTKLDRVIKACLQRDPTHRPTMNEIYRFLNDEIEL